LNYVVCLSDTGSSCHVTVMGSLIVLVNKRGDWNVPVSYVKYMLSCSACGFSTKKTSKVNTILKVVIFKHSVILFRCMICKWPEPWNFKTSHFRILYSIPSHISALFLLHTKTYDSILPGYGNDYLPWLYTQPLQNIGGANVCIVLGKWVCQTFIYGYIVTKYGCNCLKYIFPKEVCIILHSTYVFM
jgi:hypothetical protein